MKKLPVAFDFLISSSKHFRIIQNQNYVFMDMNYCCESVHRNFNCQLTTMFRNPMNLRFN
jgi:hypothetical protein